MDAVFSDAFQRLPDSLPNWIAQRAAETLGHGREEVRG
jgi:hypothetical protein